jgi:hypothetical protein
MEEVENVGKRAACPWGTHSRGRAKQDEYRIYSGENAGAYFPDRAEERKLTPLWGVQKVENVGNRFSRSPERLPGTTKKLGNKQFRAQAVEQNRWPTGCTSRFLFQIFPKCLSYHPLKLLQTPTAGPSDHHCTAGLR